MKSFPCTITTIILTDQVRERGSECIALSVSKKVNGNTFEVKEEMNEEIICWRNNPCDMFCKEKNSVLFCRRCLLRKMNDRGKKCANRVLGARTDMEAEIFKNYT